MGIATIHAGGGAVLRANAPTPIPGSTGNAIAEPGKVAERDAVRPDVVSRC
jgi:hypothetical protein